jgi:hypothetical protein
MLKLNVQYRLKLVRVNNQRGLLESVNYVTFCRKDPGRRLADPCTVYKLGSCFLIFMFSNPDGLPQSDDSLAPPPPLPLSRLVCRLSSLLEGEGGEGGGAELHHRKKAWSSINHSILSVSELSLVALVLAA